MTTHQPGLRRFGRVAVATILSTLLSAGGVAGAASAAPTDIVTFPDVALENALNVATNKPAGTPFTEQRLAAITYLQISNRGISDLSGLENVPNLTYLQLTNSPITDLTPIAGLTKLRTLNIDESTITDLSPIAGITSLKTLKLSSTGVTDLSPIAGLVNLEELTFHNDGVSSVEPLRNLVKLKSLTASINELSDLEPLAGLTALETVFLGDNQISDLTPLAGWANLQHLSIASNAIEDVAPLSGLTTLTSLVISWNRLSNVEPLAGLQNLTSLYLSHNNIADLSSLEALPITDVSSQTIVGDTLYVPGTAASFKLLNPLSPYLLTNGEIAGIVSGATQDDGAAVWDLGASVPSSLSMAVASNNLAFGSYSATISHPVVMAEYVNAPPVATTVGDAYHFAVAVTPGFISTTHDLTDGSVPGLSWDTATGTFSGTPTTAGTFVFSTASSDAAGNSVVGTWTVTVAAAAPVIPQKPVYPESPKKPEGPRAGNENSGAVTQGGFSDAAVGSTSGVLAVTGANALGLTSAILLLILGATVLAAARFAQRRISN